MCDTESCYMTWRCYQHKKNLLSPLHSLTYNINATTFFFFFPPRTEPAIVILISLKITGLKGQYIPSSQGSTNRTVQFLHNATEKHLYLPEKQHLWRIWFAIVWGGKTRNPEYGGFKHALKIVGILLWWYLHYCTRHFDWQQANFEMNRECRFDPGCEFD